MANDKKVQASEQLITRLSSSVTCLEVEHQELKKRARHLQDHTAAFAVLAGRYLAQSSKNDSIHSIQTRLDRLIDPGDVD